jgi:hypothetical protein
VVQGVLPAASVARFCLRTTKYKLDPPTAAVFQSFFTAFAANDTLLLLSTHAELLTAPAWNGSDAASAGILVRCATYTP